MAEDMLCVTMNRPTIIRVKSLSLLVFYVTCKDIAVIYVMAQMCRWTEEEVVPTVGLPTP